MHTTDAITRTFTKDVQLCVYELLTHNVSASRVGPVIQAVLNSVFPRKTPQTLATRLLNYQGLYGSDNSGRTCVLGLREIVTKSGEDTLKAFKEILCGIDDRCSATDSEKSRAILTHIVANDVVQSRYGKEV